MSTQFTWTIDQMYTLDTPEPGFVVNVLWTLTGVDGQYTAAISGNNQFVTQEGTFTPYDQLTQAQVIGWVQAALGVDGVANMEACVQGQIDSLINPPVSPQNTPLPWNS
ncbi:MAG: hypothetical protein EBR82_83085 [Caulobacteraceae bacterium]|nr:hypothetical protein [Caulobacteraceae bacterium]